MFRSILRPLLSSARIIYIRPVCSSSTPIGNSIKIHPAHPRTVEEHTARIRRLLEAKEKTGLSFTEIAKRCEITNIYCANLFYGRARADDETVSKLRKTVPALNDEDLQSMKRAPVRKFDEHQFQDPTMYRLYEAIAQNGEAIKALINEEFGDGIMSAIGFYAQVQKTIGPEGEDRVVLTFNGKFLPYAVQNTNVLEKMKKPN